MQNNLLKQVLLIFISLSVRPVAYGLYQFLA